MKYYLWLLVGLLALPLRAEPSVTLAELEAYLNGINSLKASFVQDDSTGGSANGVLYVQRPGKMRMVYSPPSPHLLVATGRSLIHYDNALKQTSYLDLDDSPARFLLSKPFSFTAGKTKVGGVFSDNGIIEVVLQPPPSPTDYVPAVILRFATNPLQLLGWRITDAQGITVSVTLTALVTNLTLAPDLFVFRDPSFGTLKP